jgi:hypothetical protein
MSRLTIQFIPYNEIDNLKSGERVKKLLKLIIENKIVVLQGKLKPDEEARLIEDTMAMIGHIKGFKGVELAVLSPKSKNSLITDMKSGISKFLVGDRESITLIGPATLVREMKKDPSKIELMLKSK